MANKAYKVQLVDKSDNQYTPMTSIYSLYKLNEEDKRVRPDIVSEINVVNSPAADLPSDVNIPISIEAKRDTNELPLITYKFTTGTLSQLLKTGTSAGVINELITNWMLSAGSTNYFSLLSPYYKPADTGSIANWLPGGQPVPIHYYDNGNGSTTPNKLKVDSSMFYKWTGNILWKQSNIFYPVLSIIGNATTSSNTRKIYNLLFGPDTNAVPRVFFVPEEFTSIGSGGYQIDLPTSNKINTVAYLSDIQSAIDGISGSLNTLAAGDGISIATSGFTKTIKVKNGAGLKIDSTKLTVATGNGIGFNNNNLIAKIKSNSGLDVDGNGIFAKISSSGGLKADSNGLAVKLPSSNSGLKTDSNGLNIKLKSGGGLTIDSDGLSVTSSGSDITSLSATTLDAVLTVSNGLKKDAPANNKLNIKVNDSYIKFNTNNIQIKKDVSTSNEIESTANITALAFYATSDITLKENIQSILDYENIPEIVQFNWKSNGRKSYGVIAQELQENYPELVSENTEGKLSVDYISALCMIIKKLENKIGTLENRIEYLENKTNI